MAGSTEYRVQIAFCGDEEQLTYLRAKYSDYEGRGWQRQNPFGLNIFIPNETLFGVGTNDRGEELLQSQRIKLGIKCRMINLCGEVVPFRIIPKPDIDKTYFRMPCHEMIFTDNCREELYVPLDLRTFIHIEDSIGFTECHLTRGQLFLQLVTRDLSTNFSVEFVESIDAEEPLRTPGITTTIPSSRRVDFMEPLIFTG